VKCLSSVRYTDSWFVSSKFTAFFKKNCVTITVIFIMIMIIIIYKFYIFIFPGFAKRQVTV